MEMSPAVWQAKNSTTATRNWERRKNSGVSVVFSTHLFLYIAILQQHSLRLEPIPTYAITIARAATR
jgi:hypothetical protein